MKTLLAMTSILSLIFAAGSVEADFYWFAFGFFVLGITSFGFYIYLEETDKMKKQNLYYKED